MSTNEGAPGRAVVGTGAAWAAPRIGVVGGGQLARMMQESANALGIRLCALVEAADGSAAQVITDSQVAQADDREAILELAKNVDVLTVEHEHVPDETLRDAEEFAPVRPGAHALAYAQDKLAMRRKMSELGVPCPQWFSVSSTAEVEEALGELRSAARRRGDAFDGAVLKTPRDGYDGKGVKIIHEADDACEWLSVGGPLLVEEKIPFEMELAQVVARRPSGEVRAWPLVRTVQQNGVCFEVVAPAPGVPEALHEECARIAQKIATELDVVGVLAVELFVAKDRVYINELAMRPHNSGHWTIEGATTSQFEQHLRAVLDLPLGDTAPRAPWSVMVNVLGSQLDDPRHAYAQVMERFPEAKIHVYGKAVKPGRKIGHVTVLGADLDAARESAHGAAAMLRGESA
ncbi:5-(carboxyamino)imidazole ribonucleotide synthase [Arcanobacterium haemolyticum]|nr:5-(carboxyamino)imidazole ribonucleotide synthase [Arcanobacterium haemolyticum]